ncbi:CUB and sushi domain-containing protein [Mytilus galloprovincialis]|uniref:CUB and sushi domain-containing protein n=1 Tax=Mytilus galloprovincialis TaxID=29158 RepID=A0A8B6FLS8_MYTGA|nr:CUB and sushi domain-containing protein [Mytilus galloprovincialis]
MPHIVLNKSVYMSETINYKDITHELGYYPDFVTVQTLLSDGYMSDGVGAVFMASTPNKDNSLSGVLYGYDESKIRLWVPTDYVGTTKGGGVFLANDGYKLGNFKSGDVKILAWNIQCSQQVFYKAFKVGDTDHDDKINFPYLYDWTNFLVSVQYKVPDESSPNGGMVFNAAGTTQANGLSEYGGVIYAYTEKEVLLWRPTNGPVVYIGDRWGNGNSNQVANTAHVIIRVYHLREAECPYPETNENATFNVTGVMYGDQTVYTCISGHSIVGGDISRIYEGDRKWSGIVPSCIGKSVYSLQLSTCPYPETVGNATFNVSGLRYGDSTVYTCNSGYSHGGGDLTRVYDSECLYPETVGNATFNVTGLRYGDSIVYTCKSGYSHGSGDLTRICCRNGQWSGIVPTCKESKQQTKGSYEDIEEVLNNIRVQRKDTSAYRRSLISVKDERLSSKVIGITGVIIFTILIGIIVVPDLITLFKHLCCSRSTNK